jgi:hypothetical protein
MDFSILQSRPLRALSSLRLSLWLLAAQVLLFLAGALQMPLMKEYASMNSMPLFQWMRQAPAAASWWLWASVALISLLALNTVLCGAQSLMTKGAGRGWPHVLPPQVIHLGFLFMMAGHLASSTGAMHLTRPMAEGSAIRLPGGNVMLLRKVEMDMSPRGYPLDWSASLEYYTPEGALIKRDVSAPNRPSFLGGLGVYVKQAAYGGALMEVHREPGTPWALGGGALFTLGTMALIGLKVRRER